MTVSFVPSHPALFRCRSAQAPADASRLSPDASALLFRLANSSPLDGHARPGAWRSSPELPAVANTYRRDRSSTDQSWTYFGPQALAERAV